MTQQDSREQIIQQPPTEAEKGGMRDFGKLLEETGIKIAVAEAQIAEKVKDVPVLGHLLQWGVETGKAGSVVSQGYYVDAEGKHEVAPQDRLGTAAELCLRGLGHFAMYNVEGVAALTGIGGPLADVAEAKLMVAGVEALKNKDGDVDPEKVVDATPGFIRSLGKLTEDPQTLDFIDSFGGFVEQAVQIPKVKEWMAAMFRNPNALG
jgi:hypothetical protein